MADPIFVPLLFVFRDLTPKNNHAVFSGVLIDKSNQLVPGPTVILKTGEKTIKPMTNKEGAFSFHMDKLKAGIVSMN